MRNYISPIISEKLPNFLKRDFKKFGRLITHFFEFLEEEGNPLELLQNFYEQCESNNQVDLYIDKLLSELGFDIKKPLLIPKKELILHLRDFYLSRGSENSFKFLFKILYGEDATIDYPRKKLLIPSQATYSGRYYIFTTAFQKDTKAFNNLLKVSNDFDVIIKGVSSKSECFVESISKVYSSNEMYLKIQIDSNLKPFINGEGLEIISLSTEEMIIENVIDCVSLSIDSPGKGYQIGEEIEIKGTAIKGYRTNQATRRW